MKRRRFITALAGLPVLFPSVQHAAEGSLESSFSWRSSFNGFHFGWIRDVPTLSKHVFRASLGLEAPLSKSVNLRKQMPPVYDQGQLGSCTSNAIAAAVQYLRQKVGAQPQFLPSRLFIYYNGRSIENTIASDKGLAISDGVRAVEEFGVCSEADWPYDSVPANDKGDFPEDARAAVRPRKELFGAAYAFRAITAYSFESVGANRLNDLKSCLAQGFPFAFGFTIYRSFFDQAGNPLIHIPVPSLQDLPVGAHAVLAVGYDDDAKEFLCRNSWGTQKNGIRVQEDGYFYLPYSYLSNDDLAADFWTIRETASLR